MPVKACVGELFGWKAGGQPGKAASVSAPKPLPLLPIPWAEDVLARSAVLSRVGRSPRTLPSGPMVTVLLLDRSSEP